MLIPTVYSIVHPIPPVMIPSPYVYLDPGPSILYRDPLYPLPRSLAIPLSWFLLSVPALPLSPALALLVSCLGPHYPFWWTLSPAVVPAIPCHAPFPLPWPPAIPCHAPLSRAMGPLSLPRSLE